ncbi:MAG: phage major capsid protein [Candidatus Berkelbacteria bacterium]|nr:phage major capsid protein [Candidatus Berkelbacteria bacterium]
MAFGNRVTTTTQDEILPKVVDTVLNSNVFATRMIGRAKKWVGEQIKQPIKVSKNSTGQSFSGFDTFSTSATNNRVNLAYSPKFYQITSALPLDELSANQTDAKVLDLAAIELASAAQDMADDIGTLFYADGTGNSSKDFLGLGAHVDDGGDVATIGGQSRSTYTTLQSTDTASSGVISLAKLSTLHSAVSSGSQKPTLGVTTEAVWNFIEQLIAPQERIIKEEPVIRSGITGGSGFTALYYRGVPIVADEKCTSQYFFWLNEDWLEFYALPVALTEPIKFRNQDIKGNDYSNVTGLGFSWSGWIKPSNSASVVGHVYLGGELCGWNPKRHGRLTGVTGI